MRSPSSYPLSFLSYQIFILTPQTPYDDDIGSYNWMGTVTRIAQNARGKVFLEVNWDWCLLDEVRKIAKI